MATAREPSGDWSPSSALEAQERQLRLWRMLINGRYVALVALGVLGLLPFLGSERWWVSVVIFGAALPYNGILDYVLRKKGVLLPILAIVDPLFIVIVTAISPDLLNASLLVMLAVGAASAVAFGRRVAYFASIVGLFGISGVAAITQPKGAVIAILTFVVAAPVVTTVVGGVAELERDLRGRYTELMGGIDAIVWEQIARKPSRLYVNRRAEEILGYPTAAWQEPGFWRSHVHPDDLPEARRRYREAIRRGESAELEYRMIAADGSIVHMHDRMRVETDEFGRAVEVRGVMLDVTAEKEAKRIADQYVDLVESIRLALFVFGVSGAAEPPDDDRLFVLAVNPEGAEVAGVNPTRALGCTFSEVFDFPDSDLLEASLADVVRTGEGWVLDEFRVNPESASGRVYSAYAFPLPGDAVGLSLQDVTERAMAAEVLRRQALHDGLTGLPNRTLLNDRLRDALEASVAKGSPVALLMMDLDQFKEVNDALGHDHGDRLLIEMSRRLQKVLRRANTIARLGGDEFAVLLTEQSDIAGATAVARTIRAMLEQPFQLGGISLQSNASIGIAVFPDHADEADALIQRADVAMYTAKRGGQGYALYSPENDQSSVRRLALLGELRRAIQEDELVLYFQPTLALGRRAIVGAEALVRWDHPEHGIMPPSEFIELAEVSGMIQPLTRWVVDAAVTQLRTWLDEGHDWCVGVNLSVRNLYDRDLVPWVSDLLVQRGVPAGLLKLEITESELMDDPMLAMEVLGKLKGLGATTSIDDFGTGYSSLAYLKHLPIDELKIDRSFVGNMINDNSDLTIVRSTIDLSHNLGLDVVAEGVEDGETLERLSELGCDRAQGYFISRPIPADEFVRFTGDTERLAPVFARLGPVGQESTG